MLCIRLFIRTNLQYHSGPCHNWFCLKNIFVPQPTEMHLLSTSKGPVANPESAGTHNDQEPDPKQTESLDVNADFWTTPAVQHSVTPDLFPVSWPTLPQPSAPSLFDQPMLASRHDRSLNFTSSLFDLSPVASSTPHVAVDTNALPQPFPFPQFPYLRGATSKTCCSLPTMQATAYNLFLQDKIQTSDHQSRWGLQLGCSCQGRPRLIPQGLDLALVFFFNSLGSPVTFILLCNCLQWCLKVKSAIIETENFYS